MTTMTTVNVLLTPLTSTQKNRLAALHAECLASKPTTWILAWTKALHSGADYSHEEALRRAYNEVWIDLLEGQPHGPALWGAVLSEVLYSFLTDEERRELSFVWDSVVSSPSAA